MTGTSAFHLEQEKQFLNALHGISPRYYRAGNALEFDLDLSVFQTWPLISCDSFGFSSSLPPGLHSAIEHNHLFINGTPEAPGDICLVIHYTLRTPDLHDQERVSPDIPIITVTPDPRKLWRDLPPPDNAPFQAANQQHQIINGPRTIVAASKRGRSHAHDGKFRDDFFTIRYLEESGWYLVAVSDGAGSAELSRQGARLACDTFIAQLTDILSSPERNQELLTMTPDEQDCAIRNNVLDATYKSLVAIDECAHANNQPRYQFAATFLGYAMKRLQGQWLIVAVGIGDGAIAVLSHDGHSTLLNTPDSGEYVGQTRFITMSEVWQDHPEQRVRAFRCDDFDRILSMTDGVSDPNFETDNNLNDPVCWHQLKLNLEASIPFEERSEATAQALEDWLDFWVKGNHDDRTITILY